MKRVVLHYHEADDIPVIYADEGVEVYSVCEYAPDDRTYRMSPGAIPEGMIGAQVGFDGDGSASEIKTIKAVREAVTGKPFGVIGGDE